MININTPKCISVYSSKICNPYDYASEVDVEITDKGDVNVQSSTADIEYIKLEYEIHQGMAFYGDAWERAYGDLRWKKEKRNMPWYCIAIDGEKVYGFGVKTQPDSLCFWTNYNDTLTLTIDIRSGTYPISLGGRKLTAATLIFAEYECDLNVATHKFCMLMCENPIKVNAHIYGGNDWYCAYGDNSYEKIMQHCGIISRCAGQTQNRPYMVIDDGWQLCSKPNVVAEKEYNGGPWKYCNSNFRNMADMAYAMQNTGVIPGIWIRPLLTVEKIDKSWILKQNGIRTILDPSIPDVIDFIQSDISCLVKWGYRLIKHDFSSFDIFGKWGFEMCDDVFSGSVKFSDGSRTTAEIIKSFYRAIREAAGYDVVIIGCNTMSHLSAGIFDVQRTGDDTSGLDWERTKRYGVNTLAFRMMQHDAFYACDADCIGITNNIPWDKNKQWLDVVSKSGTPLFVSIAGDAYCTKVENALKESFLRASSNTTVSRAVDWKNNLCPRKWESIFGRDEYDW